MHLHLLISNFDTFINVLISRLFALLAWLMHYALYTPSIFMVALCHRADHYIFAL